MSRKLDVVHLSGEEYDDLLAERDALLVPCRTLVTLLDTEDWQATLRLAVEQARAALKENKG